MVTKSRLKMALAAEKGIDFKKLKEKKKAKDAAKRKAAETATHDEDSEDSEEEEVGDAGSQSEDSEDEAGNGVRIPPAPNRDDALGGFGRFTDILCL